MSERKTPTSNNSRPDEDLLLDLNFVPQWAKKAPGENHYAAAEEQSARSGSRDRSGKDRRDNRNRTDRRPPRRDFRADDRGPRREFHPRPEKVELPVSIKFLPEQKRLSSLVRQIHQSKRAYPLIDLAHIFLSDARGHLVKIEVNPDASGFKLYQGKRSKMVATDRDVLLHQILEDHIEDFFEKEVLEVEPPSGSFPMIAKADEHLIAPPNHHSYNERLAEIHRAHYSGMSFDRFKSRVQTVRDEELVERWKQEVSTKTVYRLKEGDGEFSLVQAEDYLRTHLSDAEITEVTRAVLPSPLARKIRDYNLIRMVRESWQKESIFPIGVAFALRAAFRHLHLYTFKAGKNINFVTAIHPEPINPDDAAENIRVILQFLADHPGSTRKQLVEGLRPGADLKSDEAHEILNPIRWLVEKGHLIEFFNGTLSVPGGRKRK